MNYSEMLINSFKKEHGKLFSKNRCNERSVFRKFNF